MTAIDEFDESVQVNPPESFIDNPNPKKYETKLEEDIIDDSTYCTDTYIKEEKTDRQKNEYTSLSTENMGRKKNGDDRETENNKYSEPNCEKKQMSKFIQCIYLLLFIIDETLQYKIKKIPYTTYTQGISYKKAIFSSNIYNFLNQDINNKKPNEKILNELMKDKYIRSFLERNFLDVFYHLFVPILNYEEYRKENKIDDKEFEVWKKIIEYKPQKIKEYDNEYEKYGLYQYINEKKERKAQNKYKIVEKIFLIKKRKRDRNLDIKADNKVCNHNNQNVNSSLSFINSLKNNTNNDSIIYSSINNIPASNNKNFNRKFDRYNQVIQDYDLDQYTERKIDEYFNTLSNK